MKEIYTTVHIQSVLQQAKTSHQTIGFVATMGALHAGHISLIEKASIENDIVVASIFVNPTQFNRKEDFDNYPNILEADLNELRHSKCDIVFIPKVSEIYGINVASDSIDLDGLEIEMEGKYRPGHFEGVATVLKRFFEIIEPDRAYFGEKDYQQLLVIKKATLQNKLPVQIVGCQTYREADGLAMSSRNLRLTKKQRAVAPLIYQVLQNAQQKFSNTSISEIKQYANAQFAKYTEIELEYFEIAEAETMLLTYTKKKILPTELLLL